VEDLALPLKNQGAEVFDSPGEGEHNEPHEPLAKSLYWRVDERKQAKDTYQ